MSCLNGLLNLKSLFKDVYEFRIDMQTGALEQEKVFSVLLLITLFEKRNNTIKIELAKLNTSTSFEIQNFDEVFKKQNNTLKFQIKFFQRQPVLQFLLPGVFFR